MRPEGALSRLLRAALIVVALTAAVVFALRSLGARPAALRAAEERLDSAERERNASVARAVVVVARAAEANATTKPALARVESLRARVRIAGSGQLQVRNGDAAEPTLVTVPPLVTERIDADSVAISALTV